MSEADIWSLYCASLSPDEKVVRINPGGRQQLRKGVPQSNLCPGCYKDAAYAIGSSFALLIGRNEVATMGLEQWQARYSSWCHDITDACGFSGELIFACAVGSCDGHPKKLAPRMI
jgi:hypothetical protein